MAIVERKVRDIVKDTPLVYLHFLSVDVMLILAGYNPLIGKSNDRLQSAQGIFLSAARGFQKMDHESIGISKQDLEDSSNMVLFSGLVDTVPEVKAKLVLNKIDFGKTINEYVGLIAKFEESGEIEDEERAVLRKIFNQLADQTSKKL